MNEKPERNKKARVEQKTSNGHGSGKIEVNLYLCKSVQRLNLYRFTARFMCFDFTKVYLWDPNDVIFFFAQRNVKCLPGFDAPSHKCEGPISFDSLKKTLCHHSHRVQLNDS